MTSECAGWGEFTQAVTHHIFGDIDRHMTASVMDRNGMPTICGKITLARLQVRITFFSPF